MDPPADQAMADGDELATRVKPCKACRRRKVRCSKEAPACDNCQRANVVCEYDEEGDGPASSSTARVLARRVLELEALVQQYQRERSSFLDKTTTVPKATQSSAFTQSPFAAERIMQNEGSSNGSTTLGNTPRNLGTHLNGRLVLEGPLSRHVLGSFWASKYEETEHLKFLFREDQDKPVPSNASWWRPHNHSSIQPPISFILPPAQSERLVSAYISNVDQSVRVLHKPTLLKQLNFLWRGVLPDFQEFECQLVIVYCLALLSLSPANCQGYFGQSRQTLTEKLLAQAERGVATLSITTTHKLASLQTFVLYITYQSLTGNTLFASSLLALAIRAAQRMGIHRDGTHYNLNPWQTELRRRLWHHILLIDTWCMEQHGLESAVSIFWDTRLPLNANDSAWDVSEFATYQPPQKSGFTDNSLALVQYELAALIRMCLHTDMSADDPGHHQTLFWNFVQDTYLAGLDASHAQQRLVLEVTGLIKKRMILSQARVSGSQLQQDADSGEEARLLAYAIDYCNALQAAMGALLPARLAWVVMRAFDWHSLMTMLSSTLRMHGLSSSVDAKWALERLVTLFHDRPSIEFLGANATLWQPIEKLMVELQQRHGEVDRQMMQDSRGSITNET